MAMPLDRNLPRFMPFNPARDYGRESADKARRIRAGDTSLLPQLLEQVLLG